MAQTQSPFETPPQYPNNQPLQIQLMNPLRSREDSLIDLEQLLESLPRSTHRALEQLVKARANAL